MYCFREHWDVVSSSHNMGGGGGGGAMQARSSGQSHPVAISSTSTQLSAGSTYQQELGSVPESPSADTGAFLVSSQFSRSPQSAETVDHVMQPPLFPSNSNPYFSQHSSEEQPLHRLSNQHESIVVSIVVSVVLHCHLYLYCQLNFFSSFQHSYKWGVRTFHPEDISPRYISPQRHFTPKTFHPRTFHPGTFHPKDISPRRHFTPRTFHPTDISPHVRFTPLFEKRIQ